MNFESTIRFISRYKYILIYLVLIIIFSLFYWGLSYENFDFPKGAKKEWIDWLYFSVTTITTLGYGDITPTSMYSKALVIIESLGGLLLLGLFLNDEAHRGHERKNTESLKNQLNHCFDFLSLLHDTLSRVFGKIEGVNDDSNNLRAQLIYMKNEFKSEKPLPIDDYEFEQITVIVLKALSSFKSARSNPMAQTIGVSQNISNIIASLELIEKEHEDVEALNPNNLKNYYFDVFDNSVHLLEWR